MVAEKQTWLGANVGVWRVSSFTKASGLCWPSTLKRKLPTTHEKSTYPRVLKTSDTRWWTRYSLMFELIVSGRARNRQGKYCTQICWTCTLCTQHICFIFYEVLNSCTQLLRAYQTTAQQRSHPEKTDCRFPGINCGYITLRSCEL